MSQDSNLSVNPIPLIFDDDGSQDGMTALAYMLANPKFDVQAITISNGIARTEVFDDNIKRMLGRLGDTDIPVGVGRSTPLEGNNEFPDFIRDGSDTFWSPFVTLPEEVPDIESKSAVDLIIETIKNSPEPVAILATGPLTNIAEALRQDPSIIDNISIVQIMGGAVNVPGNLPVLPDPPFSTNETAEFNIWVDPVAAQEVFEFGEKGLKIQLTPLDATNQIEFDREDYQEWLETGTPESLIAAELLDFALEVIQSDLDPNPVWDLVAAINLSEPDFSPETPLHIDVDTESEPGENQGQTIAVPGLNPNVLVSLDPNFDNIKFDAGEVFSYVELPVVSFSVDRTTIVEGGEAQILTFNLSEPAPSGGLVANIRVDDPDGDSGPGDTTFPPEFISNITDFGQVEEDGIITASLTIAEGATEATFGVVAFEDDLVEVGETYSFTLLEDENYIVAPGSTTITTTIEEFMVPTVSISPETVISTEGDSYVWNLSLDQPVPEDGLTVNVVITQNTEPKPGDVRTNIEASTGIINRTNLVGDDDILIGFAVELAPGITEAQLVIDTIADGLQETDEINSVSIADGEDYRANPNQNTLTTTFTDRTVVTLTPEDVNVTEGDTFAWNFSLNRPAPEGGLTLSLPITLNNDPAPGDVIYNVEGSNNIEDFGFITQDDVSVGFTLKIPEGETEATLLSQAVVDDIAEFDEIFTTVLADGLDYVANPASNQVVTTIVEDGEAPPSSAPVVSIAPSALISTEGDTFAWDFTLDKPVPEGGLTLSLPITQNNDAPPGDVIYNVEGSTGITDFDFIVEDNISIGFSVTLEEGITSATLVSEAVVDDDDFEEFADEIFTTVLADGVDYRANPDSNEVQTFITGQTVVSFTPEQVNVAEGETFAWNFSLNQPAPEGGLTLSLPITFNNDPEPGDVDYNVNGSTNITDFNFLVIDDISVGFNVTIAEGETQARLVSQAVADDIAEGDEIFTTVLNDGANYRANPLSKEVVTTIVEQDSSTPVVSVTAEPTIFAENGGMGSFVFNLSQPAPEEGLKIKFETFDQDGMQGDSEVALENISDIEIITEGNNPSFIIVEPGVTEAKVIFTGIPDGVPEGEELAAFTILEGDGYTIDSNQGSANIIITDLPIVSLNAQPTNVNEGEQLKFNFELTEAAPTGGLTVNLDLVEDTDPLPGDITYFVEGSENITDFNLIVNDDTGLIDGATVTIAEGATSATLLNDIIADNNTEGSESVKFGLADGNYSIDSSDNAASFTIIDTSVANEISGTTKDDNLYGSFEAEIISGGRGDDNIAGNGGGDTLIGGRGDDDIYGGFEADEISGGRGDDFIFGNGGNDLIDSGLGFDTVFLGKGEATVVLDKGEGFDTIFNFQLGSTKLEVSSLDNLNFADGDSGAEIFHDNDLIAVVAGQSANTFNSNQDMIFAV